MSWIKRLINEHKATMALKRLGSELDKRYCAAKFVPVTLERKVTVFYGLGGFKRERVTVDVPAEFRANKHEFKGGWRVVEPKELNQ